MLPANAFCDFLEIFAGISGIDSIERPTLKTGASGPLQCPNLDVVGGLCLVFSSLLKFAQGFSKLDQVTKGHQLCRRMVLELTRSCFCASEIFHVTYVTNFDNP